jgi:hypothetical protein
MEIEDVVGVKFGIENEVDMENRNKGWDLEDIAEDSLSGISSIEVHSLFSTLQKRKLLSLSCRTLEEVIPPGVEFFLKACASLQLRLFYAWQIYLPERLEQTWAWLSNTIKLTVRGR